MSEILGLLDTNIFIDFSRQYKPAIEWLVANSESTFAIPSLVRMELVLGAQSRAEQEKIVRLLQPYALVYPTDQDAKWAMEQFELFYLSHQVEIIDCFIAAMSARLKLPIFTRNTRHLGLFQDTIVRVPY
ncbi:MAG: PIN domain-containing protein [Anaerolineae bacterium]|nr:PIN domain-containing protein [Anaerolineae bacterium]